jgi:hypothetical protein
MSGSPLHRQGEVIPLLRVEDALRMRRYPATMPRWARKSLQGAAACAIVALAFLLLIAPWLVRTLLPPEAAAARVSDALGREIQVGDVGVRFRPGPRIHLERISVPPDLRVRSVELKLRIGPLLRGAVEVAALRVEGTRMTLERRLDGTLALGDAALTVSAPANAGPATLPVLPAIEVRDSELTIVDHSAGPGAAATRVDVSVLTLHGLRVGHTAHVAISGSAGEGDARGSFDVSGTIGPLAPESALLQHAGTCEIETRSLDPSPIIPFLPESWHLGAASGAMNARVSLRREAAGDIEGSLDLELEPGAVQFSEIHFGGHVRFRAGMNVKDGALTFSDGRLEADSASLGREVAHDVRGRFAYAEKRLAFPSLAYEAFGGSLQHTGSITFDGPPLYDLTIEAAGLDLRRYTGLGDADADDPDAPQLSGHAELRGRWTGQDSWLAPSGFQPVAGSGRLEIRGGTLPAADLVHAIAKALPGTLTAVAGGAPERTRLRSFTASAVVAEGWIRTGDLDLATDHYTVTGTGRLGSDLAVDLTTAVTFIHGGAEFEYPAIPVRVSGSLGEPRLLPDMTGVPVATLRALPWFAEAVPLGVARKAGALLERGAGRVRDAVRKEDAAAPGP